MYVSIDNTMVRSKFKQYYIEINDTFPKILSSILNIPRILRFRGLESRGRSINKIMVLGCKGTFPWWRSN